MARRSALLLTGSPAGGSSFVRLDDDNERRPITVIAMYADWSYSSDTGFSRWTKERSSPGTSRTVPSSD
jgi:hypothetical protein